MTRTAVFCATRFLPRQGRRGFRKKNFASQLGYPRCAGHEPAGRRPLHVALHDRGFQNPAMRSSPRPFTLHFVGPGGSIMSAPSPCSPMWEEGTFKPRTPSRSQLAITPAHEGNHRGALVSGNPARMDEIMAVAKRNNLFVIEDCAQAIGAKYKGTAGGIDRPTWARSVFFTRPKKSRRVRGRAGAFVSRREDLHTQARHISRGTGRTAVITTTGRRRKFSHGWASQGAPAEREAPAPVRVDRATTSDRGSVIFRRSGSPTFSSPSSRAYGKSVFHQVHHPSSAARRPSARTSRKHEVGHRPDLPRCRCTCRSATRILGYPRRLLFRFPKKSAATCVRPADFFPSSRTPRWIT